MFRHFVKGLTPVTRIDTDRHGLGLTVAWSERVFTQLAMGQQRSRPSNEPRFVAQSVAQALG